MNKTLFNQIIGEFTLSTEQLKIIAANFRQDMQLGLRNPDLSSMRMLNSFIGLPSGCESGNFLALDFGGTNVRVSNFHIGNGQFSILKRVAKPLVTDSYNLISKDSSATLLFDFLADLIDDALDGDHSTPFALGHTFSFPSNQDSLHDARLIIWTKEFATPGVEGQLINQLLSDALIRKNISNVTPVAILNDTVATLLSAAFKNPNTFVASIFATGHNTCYLEPTIPAPTGSNGTIINLECGNFSKLTPNRFDLIIDNNSEKPGQQRFEKMVSGRYLGELFGLALAELLNLNHSDFRFTAVDLSAILLDSSNDLRAVSDIVAAKVARTLNSDELICVKALAQSIVSRSARLVAASFVAIIWQRAGHGKITPQHVAVDGSVYEKMPLVKENIAKAMAELLEEDATQVDTILDNGGSGLGAAIAAAMAVQK